MNTEQSKENTTILLLVSDALVRSVIQEALEHEGYMVVPVGDLGAALDLLGDCDADLLITGIYVSDIPGHSAAEYIQRKCPSVRVLIVGGLLQDDRLQTRESLAGYEVFPKPYSAAELIAKVNAVLAMERGQTPKG